MERKLTPAEEAVMANPQLVAEIKHGILQAHTGQTVRLAEVEQLLTLIEDDPSV